MYWYFFVVLYGVFIMMGLIENIAVLHTCLQNKVLIKANTEKFLWAAQRKDSKRFKEILKDLFRVLQEPLGTFRNFQEPSGTFIQAKISTWGQKKRQTDISTSRA